MASAVCHFAATFAGVSSEAGNVCRASITYSR